MSRNIRHVVLIKLGVALAAALATSGIADAANPAHSNVISGCYGKSGYLRVLNVRAGKICSPSEKAIQWDQSGPRGPAGPTGPQGLRGEPVPWAPRPTRRLRAAGSTRYPRRPRPDRSSRTPRAGGDLGC